LTHSIDLTEFNRTNPLVTLTKLKSMTLESNINEVLPEEMLKQIFHLLPLGDLKSAVLVCTQWAHVGQASTLWTSVLTIRVHQENILLMTKLLSRPRLQALQELTVMAVSEELFEAVCSHQRLKTLGIKNADMSLVPQDSLVKTLQRLESLEMRFSPLNLSQATVLFTSIAQFNQHPCQPDSVRRLKRIEIRGNNFSSLQPQILAQAVSKLEEVDLSDNMLTSDQAEAIFSAVGRNLLPKVRKLSLGNNDLNSVDSVLMGKGVNKVEYCDLRNANLTVYQVTSILRQSVVQKSLKMLNIWSFTGGGGGPSLDTQLVRLASQVIPEFLFEKDIL